MHAGLHQDAPELVRDGVVAVRERRSWQRREPYLVAVRIAHHVTARAARDRAPSVWPHEAALTTHVGGKGLAELSRVELDAVRGVRGHPLRREAVHREPCHPPLVPARQAHHVAVELVASALLQLRRHVALKLGAGAAAGASVPARGIERPGSATDKGLARELVPRVGEGARRRQEGAVVTQERVEASAAWCERADAEDVCELLKERRQASICHAHHALDCLDEARRERDRR